MDRSLATSLRPITRLGRLLAPLGLAIAVSTVSVAPTFAADVYFNGNSYKATAIASVVCNPANRSATITASATTFTLQPFSGRKPTYDNGQWITYRVWSRTYGAATWTLLYNWAPWQAIRSVTSTTYVSYLNTPRDLGTVPAYGVAHQSYQFLVEFDWWTGVDNIVSINPSYTQAYGYNTFGPDACHF